MKKITKVYLFALFFITTFTVNASEITEQSVIELIAKSDKAAETLNTSEIANLLSDDVDVTINIDIKGNKQTVTANKQKYIAMLKQGWSAYTNYKYSKSNTVIKIEGEKAIVTSDTKESMTIQGKNISTETKEESTIEIIGGKPLFTKIVGNSKMLMEAQSN